MSAKLLFCLYYLVYGINVCLSDDVPPPEVRTPLGTVHGMWKTSVEGRTYAAFEGIPYAKPPVGDLRFEEPQPFKSWSGIWEATRAYSCLQTSMTARGDEDCLYLNVYIPTKEIDPQKKYDVLAVIHGGGFMLGSGQGMVKSDVLMDRDIILVTFNFRIGILGFLSTADDAVPGNNGLKDQALALTWIKENIASFGGNPDTITVAGFSSGGASVHLHYFSPMSKGLFARGMSQSGNALDPSTIQKNPLEHARKLGSLVGCGNGSTKQLKQCLKQKHALFLLEQQVHFEGFNQMLSSPFGPVIETNSKNPFLDKDPYVLLKEKNVQDIPWIVSVCSEEGLLPGGWHYKKLEKVDGNWSKISHLFLDYNSTLPVSKRKDVAKKIKRFYLGPGEHFKENNFRNFSKMFTDRLFLVGAETAAKLQSEANKSPVYFYVFNYTKGVNGWANLYSDEIGIKGAAHGDDAIYFYGFLSIRELSETDKKLKTGCQDILYSYTTTGKPSFDGTDRWQPTGSSELTYLNITDPEDVNIQTTKSLAPIEFWTTLGLSEYESIDIKDELYEKLPRVKTPLGKISGTWLTSLHGRKFAAFEGIPYAKPPVGDLRFEKPQPIEPWTGVWHAKNLYSCLQVNPFDEEKIDGEEDCLYLNVFVPTDDMTQRKKFDVLVIIHGGAFTMGSAHMMAYSKFLMDRDFIVVTLNYRLGFFGFLSTEDEIVPGNNGMKDQVVALKWIKDNIASFGGKPDTITVAGLSAGGASVHLHYLSPMSKGLFVRGISQSGAALDPWVIKEKPLENARKLGTLAGCDDIASEELKECLKERPARYLMEKLKHFYGYSDKLPMSPFAPVVEKNSEDPFLTEHPYELLKHGHVLDVPWITSTTANDGLYPAAWYYTDLEAVEADWPEVAHYLLDYNYTLPASKRKSVAKQILDFYLGPGQPLTTDNFDKFAQIFTDRLFAIGGETAAKLQSKANKSPVYYYVFNYTEGVNSLARAFAEDIKGVSHAEDSIYFYGVFHSYVLTVRDLKLKHACLDMLYSYVTTGKPSFDGTDNWKPTKDSELTYLYVVDERTFKLRKTKSLTPVGFWKKLGLLESENLLVKDEL